MKAVAAKWRRFGYQRIGVMQERKAMITNHKKLYRLYTDEKLGVRRRRGRKRATQMSFAFLLESSKSAYAKTWVEFLNPRISI